MTMISTTVSKDAFRFLLVGVGGIVVNVGVTWGVHLSTHQVLTAAAVGMFASVITNFLMLEHWVFHDRVGGRIWGRFFGFLAIGLVDFLVRAPFLQLLVPVIGIVAATVLTLALVFVVRFLVSRHLLWKSPVVEPDALSRRISPVSINPELAEFIANLPAVLRPSEVAEIFGVNPKSVIRWAETGQIRSFRTIGKHHRFYKADVLAQLEAGTIDIEAASISDEPADGLVAEAQDNVVALSDAYEREGTHTS